MFVLDRRINNLRDTLNLRRRLRKNMTPAEVALWTMIRKRQVGNYRFQRQFGIGPYVADFYFCFGAAGVESVAHNVR